MRTPDATLYHRPQDPDYLRFLIDQSGLTQAAVAIRIGVSPRRMREYLAGEPIPYAVQFCMEQIAADQVSRPAKRVHQGPRQILRR